MAWAERGYILCCEEFKNSNKTIPKLLAALSNVGEQVRPWLRKQCRWGCSEFCAAYVPGGQKWVCRCEDTQFILVLLLINCCIIFHTNNCKPTLPHPV